MSRSRSRLTPLARDLRKPENMAEARLWHVLRNRQLGGLKFRRQFPIGSYIADFVCTEKRLVVELDGSQHADSAYDQVRNAYMNAQGWSVARFYSGEVLRSRESVIETIAGICEGHICGQINDPDFQFYPAMTNDITYMRRAIALATAQMGRTWPNPAVGCVIVKDGAIIAEGATGDGGRPHAEEAALQQAGDTAKGATAYVTLEPCGERSTGTASCSQRLVEAGVGQVIYACADPSPFASHKGPTRLHAAHIPMETGLLADEAAKCIAGFVHFIDTGRPRVSESEDGVGYDAEYTSQSLAALAEDLATWGAKGYRSLFVRPGSLLSTTLQVEGLLAPAAR